MTFALEGGGGLPNLRLKEGRLCGFGPDKGEGVQNAEINASRRHMYTAPAES